MVGGILDLVEICSQSFRCFPHFREWTPPTRAQPAEA